MIAKTFDKQTAKFLAVVGENMPELSGDVMQGWIQNPKALQKFLMGLCPRKPVFRSRVVSSFTIICGGNSNTSELVAAGNYDWSNKQIAEFPLKPHAPVTRKIEFVEFCDHDPTSEEVLDELALIGLKRPTAEDALQFGLEHSEEQRKRPIVFLHESVLNSGSNLYAFVLSGSAGERDLSLCWFDSMWDRHYVFAGVSG